MNRLAPHLAVLLAALGACESAADRQRRESAEAEARVYADEAGRMSDRGARTTESADAKELLRLYEARRSALSEIDRRSHELTSLGDAGATRAVAEEEKRLLEEDRKRLALADDKIAAQRKRVEANRDTLVALQRQIRAELDRPAADAGPSRDVLRERLSGIEASLAETNEALAGAKDSG